MMTETREKILPDERLAVVQAMEVVMSLDMVVALALAA